MLLVGSPLRSLLTPLYKDPHTGVVLDIAKAKFILGDITIVNSLLLLLVISSGTLVKAL
jgi:hypothetical protein